eukprot:scaffold47_cov258-Pinguiococcus_pyrenoidosus.AAC.98
MEALLRPSTTTLYCRNLPDDVRPLDLTHHFSRAAGFKAARLRRSRAANLPAGRGMCAFVEFESVAAAEHAMRAFEGSELLDAGGGATALELEFTRDANHRPVNAPQPRMGPLDGKLARGRFRPLATRAAPACAEGHGAPAEARDVWKDSGSTGMRCRET